MQEEPSEISRDAVQQAVSVPASTRCLFVIGSARSGTTILQNALNDSSDIFLFGEPNFHLDSGQPGFAARYNATHRSWANQETKSTYCPPLLGESASWHECLLAMSNVYKLTGSKIVLGLTTAVNWYSDIFDFQCRHFYRSRYLFCFRHPVDVLLSTLDLQKLVLEEEKSSIIEILSSYTKAVGLFIRMLRNLPHVTAVFHEDVSEATFVRLQEILGASLEGSSKYYNRERVRKYDIEQIDYKYRSTLQHIIDLYSDLRNFAGQGFALAQIEQNNRNVMPGYLIGVGYIYRRVEVIVAGLAAAAFD